jgi:hypothetical protein
VFIPRDLGHYSVSQSLAPPPKFRPLRSSAYGWLPYLEDVAISPDGTRLAFVQTSEDSRNLYVTESSGKLLGRVSVGKTKLRSIIYKKLMRPFY